MREPGRPQRRPLATGFRCALHARACVQRAPGVEKDNYPIPQTQTYVGRGRAWCTMKCRASPTSGGREARRTASPIATVRAPSVMRSNAVILAPKRARTDACARASQLTREGAHGDARPAAAAEPAHWVLSGVRQAPATQAPDRRWGAGGRARRARACTPSSAMPLKRMRLSSVAWQCCSQSLNLRSRLPGPSAAARAAPLSAVRGRGAPQQAGGHHTGRAEAAGSARAGLTLAYPTTHEGRTGRGGGQQLGQVVAEGQLVARHAERGPEEQRAAHAPERLVRHRVARRGGALGAHGLRRAGPGLPGGGGRPVPGRSGACAAPPARGASPGRHARTGLGFASRPVW